MKNALEFAISGLKAQKICAGLNPLHRFHLFNTVNVNDRASVSAKTLTTRMCA